MNQLLLSPTDVLFFRDGRPMSGSLSGHGTAWPLPTVTNAALHAALHRAELQGVHGHDHHQEGGGEITDARKFGSLLTAGPFPVVDGAWLFPRPLDAGIPDRASPSFLPLDENLSSSSLPDPLKFPVANTVTASKNTPEPWWNKDAWAAYLGEHSEGTPAFHRDTDFSDIEHQIGIGIDPATGTQDGERFYSAHYLRLKPGHRLGLLAAARDKILGDSGNTRDLIAALFPNSGTESPVIVGGQQRVCTVRREPAGCIPLPHGKTTGFRPATRDGKELWLVKWVLLSPAVFPEITAGISKRGTERKPHPGGWLPSWICPESGTVLLQSVSSEERKQRRRLNAAGKGYESRPDIPATLVAAMTGKPVPVTGYALPHEQGETRGGPKPTHLAVPAGSVYYFTCPTSEAAEKLAAALNWHGTDTSPTTIKNRRSTLFGEKGFGLGLCGTWQFHGGKLPR